VGIRSCTVSFEDGAGIRHTVQVTAESVFEAAALALRAFEQAGAAPGPAAHLEIAAQTPGREPLRQGPACAGVAELEWEVAQGAGSEIPASGQPG
jgi:hypothetical protein